VLDDANTGLALAYRTHVPLRAPWILSLVAQQDEEPFGARGKHTAKAKKLAETSLAAGRRKPMPSGLAMVVPALYNYADWQS
jgi:hypothetical protein